MPQPLGVQPSYLTHVTPLPAASPSVFSWEGASLRSFKDPQGFIWFVAKDVCEALDLTNTARALARLDPDEKGITNVNTLRGEQGLSTVSEAGLYALVLRSRKPEARAFKRWLTHTVLPTIRQDGVYIKGEELLLSAATEEQLQAAIEAVRAKAAQAVEAKATRGVCAREEREARATAFKILSSGRKPKRKPF